MFDTAVAWSFESSLLASSWTRFIRALFIKNLVHITFVRLLSRTPHAIGCGSSSGSRSSSDSDAMYVASVTRSAPSSPMTWAIFFTFEVPNVNVARTNKAGRSETNEGVDGLPDVDGPTPTTCTGVARSVSSTFSFAVVMI